MGILNWRKNRLDEANKSFKTKLKPQKKDYGEGHEDLNLSGQSLVDSLSSFNLFNKYINQQHKNEQQKIDNYRSMAAAPEISDVVEDAVLESVQENEDGYTLDLDIVDKDIADNENKVKTLKEEFEELFFNRLKIEEQLWNILYSYYIDGRVYMERIGKNKVGITDLKLLPCETMDFKIGDTGRIEFFVQYLKKDGKLPANIEEAEKDTNIIAFYPSQISYINSGLFGSNRKDVIGYLEKAKQPYNQLKLLETAVIIYRIIRAPERFVFRIDTGNMPKEKAMKYVEKLKSKFQRSETYDPDTGNLVGKTDIMCIRKNTDIKLLDGRNISLSKIIDEFNEGKENWVYTINQNTNEIEPGKITNAAITRKNEKLIRVHLDDNNYIDTTYDHKFVMRDGSEKRADELKESDSLMPLYTKLDKIENKQKLPDYEYVYNLNKDKWETTHKIVCESTQRNRLTNEVIHHKDFCSLNNNPNNLLLVDRKDHLKYHGDHAGDLWKYNYEKMHNGILKGKETLRKDKVSYNNMRNKLKEFWQENYNYMCKVRKEQGERMKNDENWRKKRSADTTYWNKKLNKADKMLEALNKPENREHQKQRAKEAKNEFWSNSENRKKMSYNKTVEVDKNVCEMLIKSFIEYGYPKRDELIKKINSDPNNKLMSYIKNINEHKYLSTDLSSLNKWTMGKILEQANIDNYKDLREKYQKNADVVNHKVKKIEYLDERDDTGCITVEGNHNFAVSCNGQPTVFIKNSMLENFWLPQSADGRGSQIDTIGGNFSSFAELDDIYYFQRKLYRALKYPMSRVTKMQENQEGDMLFAGGRMGEITRDEIKWAKFLERQQNRICYDLKEIFLLHLEFKGIKKEYELKRSSFNIHMTAPNQYKDQIDQLLLETRQNNYQNLANNPEFPKTWLMASYLGLDEDDFKEIAEYAKKDEKYLPKEEDMF